MKIVLFANTDWYLFNFRSSLAAVLRDLGHEVVFVAPRTRFAERLAALGCRFVEAPMQRRSINPVREILFVFWLVRLLRRERPDLIHGFTIKGAVYGALAGRIARVPARVSAVEGLGYAFTSDDLKARLLRPAIRALLRLALSGAGTRLILQNRDDVRAFERSRLLDPSLIRQVRGTGIDCSRFAPAPGRRRGARFRVLLPARLLWDKGVGEFVEAARRLRTEGRQVDFLLAGNPDPGNPAAIPDQAIRGWVEEGVIEWLGHVDDMPALLHSVDAVALPSYREGLPQSLLEAGACGLPVAAADVPGCREVVEHGVTGLLFPPRSPEALAAAVRQLEDDPPLCVRLGDAARARMLAHFDQGIVHAQTLEVYGEIVSMSEWRLGPAL
jgi:glycosyltransferase involved in cell wall biosynthesis